MPPVGDDHRRLAGAHRVAHFQPGQFFEKHRVVRVDEARRVRIRRAPPDDPARPEGGVCALCTPCGTAGSITSNHNDTRATRNARYGAKGLVDMKAGLAVILRAHSWRNADIGLTDRRADAGTAQATSAIATQQPADDRVDGGIADSAADTWRSTGAASQRRRQPAARPSPREAQAATRRPAASPASAPRRAPAGPRTRAAARSRCRPSRRTARWPRARSASAANSPISQR